MDLENWNLYSDNTSPKSGQSSLIKRAAILAALNLCMFTIKTNQP